MMKHKLTVGVIIGSIALSGCAVKELWDGIRFLKIMKEQDEQATADAGPWPRVQDTCALCHGVKGQSSNEEYPSLAGLSASYIESQLEAFANGSRPHSQMTPLAYSLSQDQIVMLSAYYEKQEPMKTQSVGLEAGLVDKGEKLTQQYGCIACHGEDLMGGAIGPQLAGQARVYLIDQLKAYKAGNRHDPSQSMAGVTANMDSGQMALVAGYISSLDPEDR